MLILAIETATPQVGVAIIDDGVRASFHAAHDRRHAEALTPAIQFVSQQAGVELAQLDAVSVDVGPGLFTGLRVGLSTAKTIAQALEVPMIGASSLETLALATWPSSQLVVPAVDARRGELFVAVYRRLADRVEQLRKPAVLSPEEALVMVQDLDADTLVVGDGAVRYADLFEPARRVELASPGLRYPSATVLAELASSQATRNELVPPHEIEPMYLRGPDAVANWKSAS